MPSGRIVVVGASLGGLVAIEQLLGAMGAEFPYPVAIVLHRGADNTPILGRVLDHRSPLRVSEPEDKEAIVAGRVYVAPSDYHLLVDGSHFALSTEGKVHFARPSIDVLFESAAESWGAGVIAVVLTGGSRDGVDGCRRIKAAGGLVLVQDPKTAEARTLPDAALTAVQPDHVLPVPDLGAQLRRLAG